MNKNRVCMIGLGYVGLPTASLLANSGFQVVGVDKKETVVQLVNNGGVHIEEPGLKALVTAAVKSGFLRARVTPEKADVFFIAVPTPVIGEGDAAEVDLSYVRQAASDILPFLKEGDLVILESTSPPGTTAKVVAPILEKSGLTAGAGFYLAYCPERVLPGNTLAELIHNSRVVGGINRLSAEKARTMYRRFVKGEILLTDATTAEMVKVMENTYRDVNIALANEFARICEQAGVSAWEAAGLANFHPRVSFHLPGPGVGGHCIPVDPCFVISAFREKCALITLGRQINERQPALVVKRLQEILEDVSAPRVTILGLAYKGNINDTRNSPALKIVDLLEREGIGFGIYDPHVAGFKCETRDIEAAFQDSDCILVLTGHDEYRALAPEEVGGLMRRRRILDTRNCLERAYWEAGGFQYHLWGADERLQEGMEKP